MADLSGVDRCECGAVMIPPYNHQRGCRFGLGVRPLPVYWRLRNWWWRRRNRSNLSAVTRSQTEHSDDSAAPGLIP